MFDPWIGKDFAAGRRLLILGESTYSWMEEGVQIHPPQDHSIRMVREVIGSPPGTNRFQKMITRGLCGEAKPTAEKVKAAWGAAAFTNYVPQRVGDAPRARPTYSQWEEARKEWPFLLSLIKPKAVIVLGYLMWQQLPSAHDDLSESICSYNYDDSSSVVCWRTWHPSGGGSWESIAQTIQKATAA